MRPQEKDLLQTFLPLAEFPSDHTDDDSGHGKQQKEKKGSRCERVHGADKVLRSLDNVQKYSDTRTQQRQKLTFVKHTKSSERNVDEEIDPQKAHPLLRQGGISNEEENGHACEIHDGGSVDTPSESPCLDTADNDENAHENQPDCRTPREPVSVQIKKEIEHLVDAAPVENDPQRDDAARQSKIGCDGERRYAFHKEQYDRDEESR